MSQQYHAVVKKADVRWSCVSRSASCKTGLWSECLVQLWASYQERQGPTQVRPGQGCGNDELSASRARGGKTAKWFNLERGRHGNSLMKHKRLLQTRTSCSLCPTGVERYRDLISQEIRFRLYVKGKLPNIRLASHLNRWCGASGKKIRSLGDLWSWEISITQGCRNGAGLAQSA